MKTNEKAIFEDEKLDDAKRKVLNKKLEDIIVHARNLKEQKKASAAGFKEQIDACNKKIDSLADTLQTGVLTYLHNGFNQFERDDLFLRASVSAIKEDLRGIEVSVKE